MGTLSFSSLRKQALKVVIFNTVRYSSFLAFLFSSYDFYFLLLWFSCWIFLASLCHCILVCFLASGSFWTFLCMLSSAGALIWDLLWIFLLHFVLVFCILLCVVCSSAEGKAHFEWSFFRIYSCIWFKVSVFYGVGILI